MTANLSPLFYYCCGVASLALALVLLECLPGAWQWARELLLKDESR